MPRPKFTILTILLCTALVAVTLALIAARVEVAGLDEDRRRIMEEVGYIDVQDPAKVYVRELFCPAPLTWQVQVYTPPGHKLRGGMGTDLQGSWDEPYPARLLEETYFRRTGQTRITISLFREQGVWRVSRYYRFNGTDMRLPEEDFAWLVEQERRGSHSGQAGEPVHGPVRVYEATERIPLLILRNEATNRHSSLMIWLEPDLKAHFKERQKKQEKP